MNTGRAARRLGRLIVHNWPLKLAAVAVATLLYAGLVASQDSDTFPGLVKVTPVNQPADTVITQTIRDVDQIRYIAPAELGPLRVEDFRATVDLTDVKPDGNPVSLRVNVTAFDPRVQILEVRPRTVQVVLDQKIERTVKVDVVTSELPEGISIGTTTVDPEEITITGPSASVNRVVSARVSVTVDASQIDIARDVRPDLVDETGTVVTGVDMEPGIVRVEVPVIANLSSRTVPVNPAVTGSPAAGFRIASVTVTPLTVTLEGDQDQLQALVSADTAPVSVSGATRDITTEVTFALPTGVSVVGAQTATVTVSIAAVTETRTYPAGIKLDGRNAALEYAASETKVLLTLFGSSADLDLLTATPIVISINVADLEPGPNEVILVPSLPSAITVAAISPASITVTVTERPTPTPPPTPAPEPSVEPLASVEPSRAPVP
ncbi:MAG TPA: CdaR family protein [Candidatus Limnocylindrales bacterium]|nr:CdaR family protein [Candidatus Limnocylindrales bacterium]